MAETASSQPPGHLLFPPQPRDTHRLHGGLAGNTRPAHPAYAALTEVQCQALWVGAGAEACREFCGHSTACSAAHEPKLCFLPLSPDRVSRQGSRTSWRTNQDAHSTFHLHCLIPSSGSVTLSPSPSCPAPSFFPSRPSAAAMGPWLPNCMCSCLGGG